MFQVLDFKKVKPAEREKASDLFRTQLGKSQLKDIKEQAKTFVPGAPLPEATNKQSNPAGLTPEQVKHFTQKEIQKQRWQFILLICVFIYRGI